MSATVQEVMDLIDMDECLEYIGADSTTNSCHNATAWLVLKIKQAMLSDYNLYWCVGWFNRKDHGWLQVEDPDTGDHTIIDLTIDQFTQLEVPYKGPVTESYQLRDSCNLCEPERFPAFIDSLGD